MQKTSHHHGQNTVWRLAKLVILILCGLLLLPTQRGIGQTASSVNQIDSEQYLIHFEKIVAQTQVNTLISDTNFRVIRRLPALNVWVVENTGQNDIHSSIMQLLSNNLIGWIEPNGQVHASDFIPNDPYFQPKQHNLLQIGMPTAWLFSHGDHIPIAVIDTGIDLDHPDLQNNLWINTGEIPSNGLDDDHNGYIDDIHGWDFVSRAAPPQDDASHGSHVSGVLAAQTNNNIGIAGVAGAARIVPLKALDKNGDGTWADVAEAIIYAANMHIPVINLSLGGETYSQVLAEAVAYAHANGCLIIAAAGNSAMQPTAVNYPAALPDVIGVGAINELDMPWAYSNRGATVDLAAPGVQIFSANNLGGYYSSDGTSMATPQVSGAAALIWQLNPNLTADEISQILISSSLDIYQTGWDERTGWGALNVEEAILQVSSPVLNLSSDKIHLESIGDTAVITAIVSDRYGSPVPDGVKVAFSTSSGSLQPLSGITQNGQVISSYTGMQTGSVTIQASVGRNIHDSINIQVGIYRQMLPFVKRAQQIQ